MSPNTSPPSALMRLRARYFAWARNYYVRKKLPPEQIAQAIALDEMLYSRRGLGIWLGLAGSFAGCLLGLRAAGMDWIWAAVLSIVIVGGIAFALFATWLRPEQFTVRKLWRIALIIVIATYAGSITGVLTRTFTSQGPPPTLERFADILWRATPFQLLIGLGLVLVMWVTATARRQMLDRELAQLRIEQERDAAARQAAEAQLKLLRAQIQPHFIFNTLSALQHWVDTADPRAPALLRSLTGFLRSSTELLGRDETTVGEEMGMVRHYLAVMQQRLGERLRHEVDVDAAMLHVRLPPGVLLTLVENAIEHGVAPALSGGMVRVHALQEDTRGLLRVEDDGAGLGAAWQEGVGLANVRERLQHQFGSAASLTVAPATPHGCVATVTLPMAARVC
jgi:sensor histidine kinase YesM